MVRARAYRALGAMPSTACRFTQNGSDYVRREDAIRAETVINAKLDALAVKIDAVAERQKRT